jgi:formylglycine-generating enzyme required for sulfatase activity
MTIEKRSFLDHAERWDRALASIADRKKCPAYDGLVIEERIGLVPLGSDPESGLWEFAHLQTGEIPERGADGKLVLAEEMGLVFVLIPGGTFHMGASSDKSLGSPNADPKAADWEGPVHVVRIKPFFLSKYEMTQGQWLRFTGKMPCAYGPDNYNPLWNRDKAPHSLLHPMEQVSWKDCEEVLFRLKLRFPTESEWEYAARAGTTTIWWTGNAKESLQAAGNIADLFCKQNGPRAGLRYETMLDDGFVAHAPIGSFRPNAFGLHDVCGNVYEWCRDSFGEYSETPYDGSAHESSGSSYRIYRGGSFTDHAERCRSADRHRKDPNDLDHSLGIRPASSL